MKGICLAGGSGNRLFPLTRNVTKQLLPVFDKPAIYYSITSLLFCGIREIVIIGKEYDVGAYKELFGNGKHLGLDISYIVQNKPNGIAEALTLVGAEFWNDDVCLVLGDNFFYGADLRQYFLEGQKKLKSGNTDAVIFSYRVANPEEFGVVNCDSRGAPVEIQEKPKNPKSDEAVVGVYMYSSAAYGIAKNIKPSRRGELEITDVNNFFLKKGRLSLVRFGRGIAWLDIGNSEALFESSMLVRTIQKQSGLHIANVEEVCYNLKYITKKQLKGIVEKMPSCSYREYLIGVINEKSSGNR